MQNVKFFSNTQRFAAHSQNYEQFIHDLACLADIFDRLNELNLSIQGPKVTIMDAAERMKAFLVKLSLWKKRLEADNYQIFQC